MLINEILPNPAGKDADGEWIEILNDGAEAVSLAGWRIKDASGKTFIFKNKTLSPGEYFILDYRDSKISLNNNGERLELYNDRGDIADIFEYTSVPQEGWSVIRGNSGFSFSDQPTPGAVNSIGAPQSYFSALLTDAGPLSVEGAEPSVNFSAANIAVAAAVVAAVLAIIGTVVISKFNVDAHDSL